ncbi:ADP-ribosylation factor-like protein 9 [Suncus etruscus]|uniref:ADP-ribosylation factor-like protein 9 n=1 Tax=Suncus etruscus TaxID=109475 RepID=UPI002110776D|nr:ADP-ribosylation factor-like protein 9 [Suncus etruscus]
MEKGKPKKREKGRDSRDSDKEKNGSKVKESEKEKERNGSRGRELDRERNGSRGKELEERERNGKPKEPVEKERNGAREKEPEKEKNEKGREPEKEKRVKEGEREKSGRAKEPEKEKNGVKSKESEEKRKEGEKEKVKEKERGRDRAKEERHREEKRKDLEKEKHKEKEEREKNSPALINPLMELPDKNKQILVLGLDGAGKTSLLHSLALNRVQHSMAPTQGFNAVCINTEDSQMEFLEIGGSEAFRPYWQKYMSKGLLLVFVVDSADHNRLPEAREQLHQLIRTNPLLPLVVFANKQDLDTAYHITDIHDALALSEVGNNRKMFLFGTQVTENGSEIPPAMQDARDLIAQLAADMQ